MIVALSAYIDCDSDAGSALTRTRLQNPLTASIKVDSDAGTKLEYGQIIPYAPNILADSDAATALIALRRTLLGRRPQIHLSAWTNDGLVALSGQTIRRGDLHHLQANVIGTKLAHFTLVSFVLKGSVADDNADAIAWKSNRPDRGGIERLSLTDTTDKYGAAQQAIYQIALDPRDTARLTSRRTLQWEFQLDDTLGEVYSVAGSVTIIPDIYQYPS